MKTTTRYPVAVSAGSTFRFPFRIGDVDGTTRTYYTNQEITKVTFRVRSSDNESWTDYDMTYSDDSVPTWWAVLTPKQTKTLSTHRSAYYGIEVTYASGDVVRELEGPLQVRPLGGYR